MYLRHSIISIDAIYHRKKHKRIKKIMQITSSKSLLFTIPDTGYELHFEVTAQFMQR